MSGDRKQIEQLLLTEQEAAGSLAISPKTLERMRKRGEIGFIQIGRCVRYELQSLLDYISSFRHTVSLAL